MTATVPVIPEYTVSHSPSPHHYPGEGWVELATCRIRGSAAGEDQEFQHCLTSVYQAGGSPVVRSVGQCPVWTLPFPQCLCHPPRPPPSLSPITTPSFESLGPMIVVPSPSLENEPLHHPILRICRFRHLEKSSQALLKGMHSLLLSDIPWSWRSWMRGSSVG